MKVLKEITVYYNNDLYEGKSSLVRVEEDLSAAEVMKKFLGASYSEFTCDWTASAYFDKIQDIPFTFRVRNIDVKEL